MKLIDIQREQRRNSLPAAVCTMTMLSTRAPKWPPAAHRLIFTPLNSYFSSQISYIYIPVSTAEPLQISSRVEGLYRRNFLSAE